MEGQGQLLRLPQPSNRADDSACLTGVLLLALEELLSSTQLPSSLFVQLSAPTTCVSPTSSRSWEVGAAQRTTGPVPPLCPPSHPGTAVTSEASCVCCGHLTSWGRSPSPLESLARMYGTLPGPPTQKDPHSGKVLPRLPLQARAICLLSPSQQAPTAPASACLLDLRAHFIQLFASGLPPPQGTGKLPSITSSSASKAPALPQAQPHSP